MEANSKTIYLFKIFIDVGYSFNKNDEARYIAS